MMPGRGQGAKRRRGAEATGPRTRASAKRARPALDDGTEPARGINHNVIDFNEIICEAQVHAEQDQVNASSNSSITNTSPVETRILSNAGNAQTLPLGNLDVGALPYNGTCLPPVMQPSANMFTFNETQNVENMLFEGHELTRVAQDDITLHVPPTLKQKICKGEYVNLSLLIKGAVELAELYSGSTLKLNTDGTIAVRPTVCKDDIGTIERWTDAFIVYMSIYLSTHPSKIHEMLHYFYVIRECASRQGGQFWKIYDQQFRLRQATTPSSWSVINQGLWSRCLPSMQDTYRYKQFGVESRKHGQSQNICVAFNKGSCSWPSCKYNHACINCGGTHNIMNCHTGTQSGPSRFGYQQGTYGQSQTYNAGHNTQQGFTGNPFRGRRPYRGRGYNQYRGQRGSYSK